VTLTNAFSIYEHWADELLASLGEGQNQGKLLQRDVGSSGQAGLVETVQRLCAPGIVNLKGSTLSGFFVESEILVEANP
jgi:hypothetical protein